ncbi:HNH endonuclease signature motif containing protein [Blastococcus sp. TF02-9]|uniref:HNH endonuclease signature motif containing protein n=1 Tax=Blastococcus sp. TF02-09 TaxID=2250576 RepID=UPI001F39B384|nr:HNH endonuclease signature motif containing protein [Blastococcus sp. TF02-9]
MQRLAGTSIAEGVLFDWVSAQPEAHLQLPAEWLDDAQVARELAAVQRDRARQAAREAELILRLAELRPDTDDPAPGTPGARRRTWRKTDPEFPGVSEFFPDELAHAINLGRGTASFRARRAFTWRENLPATFAALREGRLDERRAGVLAEALQSARPELARAVEAALLSEAEDMSPTRLQTRALELLAELDATAIDERRAEAQQAADVRTYPTADGMAVLTAEMSAEEAAACYAVIDQLAAMAKADGDERPIGQIRSAIHSMLIRRPADHGLPGVTVQLTVTAALDGLEGTSSRGGEVDGFPITAAHVRDLLRRIEAIGLTTPAGGSLTFAITDERGQLLATVTAAELARLAARGCVEHPGDGGIEAEQPSTDHSEAEEPATEQPEPEEPAMKDSGAGHSEAEHSEAEHSEAEHSEAEHSEAPTRVGDGSGAEATGDEGSGGCACAVLGPPDDVDAYTPGAAQRRFVTTRDRRCRFPNCGQRVGLADLDHVVAHAAGGRTSCANLCCACRSHHRLKTFAAGWDFRLDRDGTLHVTSPSGVTRTTRPPGLRPPGPEPSRPAVPADPPPF